MALERVKVSPKVDLFLLAPTDEGMNVGPRDEVLHLSLDSPCGKDVIFQFHQVHLGSIEVLQWIKV